SHPGRRLRHEPRGRRRDRGQGARAGAGGGWRDPPLRRRRGGAGGVAGHRVVRMTLADVAAVTGGTLTGDGAVAVEGAATDSRDIDPGRLFVPLRAERDGHLFITAAVAAGAAAYLTAGPQPSPAPSVLVPDTLAALGALGEYARRRLSGAVIGITGS